MFDPSQFDYGGDFTYDPRTDSIASRASFVPAPAAQPTFTPPAPTFTPPAPSMQMYFGGPDTSVDLTGIGPLMSPQATQAPLMAPAPAPAPVDNRSVVIPGTDLSVNVDDFLANRTTALNNAVPVQSTPVAPMSGTPVGAFGADLTGADFASLRGLPGPGSLANVNLNVAQTTPAPTPTVDERAQEAVQSVFSPPINVSYTTDERQDYPLTVGGVPAPDEDPANVGVTVLGTSPDMDNYYGGPDTSPTPVAPPPAATTPTTTPTSNVNVTGLTPTPLTIGTDGGTTGGGITGGGITGGGITGGGITGGVSDETLMNDYLNRRFGSTRWEGAGGKLNPETPEEWLSYYSYYAINSPDADERANWSRMADEWRKIIAASGSTKTPGPTGATTTVPGLTQADLDKGIQDALRTSATDYENRISSLNAKIDALIAAQQAVPKPTVPGTSYIPPSLSIAGPIYSGGGSGPVVAGSSSPIPIRTVQGPSGPGTVIPGAPAGQSPITLPGAGAGVPSAPLTGQLPGMTDQYDLQRFVNLMQNPGMQNLTPTGVDLSKGYYDRLGNFIPAAQIPQGPPPGYAEGGEVAKRFLAEQLGSGNPASEARMLNTAATAPSANEMFILLNNATPTEIRGFSREFQDATGDLQARFVAANRGKGEAPTLQEVYSTFGKFGVQPDQVFYGTEPPGQGKSRTLDVPGGQIVDTAPYKQFFGEDKLVFLPSDPVQQTQNQIAAQKAGKDTVGRTMGIVPGQYNSPITQDYVQQYNQANPAAPLTEQNYMDFYNRGLTDSAAVNRALPNYAMSPGLYDILKGFSGLEPYLTPPAGPMKLSKGGDVNADMLRELMSGDVDEVGTARDMLEKYGMSPDGEYVSRETRPTGQSVRRVVKKSSEQPGAREMMMALESLSVDKRREGLRPEVRARDLMAQDMSRATFNEPRLTKKRFS